jgi:hypothetical protein
MRVTRDDYKATNSFVSPGLMQTHSFYYERLLRDIVARPALPERAQTRTFMGPLSLQDSDKTLRRWNKQQTVPATDVIISFHQKNA